MFGSERGPFALLGGRGLGDTFSESGPSNLRVSCEELRHSTGSAVAQDGSELAKESDAIRRHSIRKPEYDALCGTPDSFRLSTALLSRHGNQNGSFSSRGGERVPRFGRDQCQRDRVRAGAPMLPFGG